jgi:phosphorylcholine metabolism protein LicD
LVILYGRRGKLYTYFWAENIKLEGTYCRYALPKEEQLLMLKTAERITSVLDKENIDIWIGYGALLGYHRHDSLIPWDDDLDMECFSINAPKILELLKGDGAIIKKEQYEFIAGFYTVLYKDIGGKPVEIFLIQKDDQGISSNTGFIYNFLNKREVMKIENRYPVEYIDFSGYRIKKPVNSIDYIDTIYPKWDKKAIIDPHHSNNSGDETFKPKIFFDWPVDYTC